MERASLGAGWERLRSESFVGRRAERALFATALDDAACDWSVVWIHGPGGVGKSTLIGQLSVDARASGADVVALDSRALATCDPGAVRRRLMAELEADSVRVVFVDAAEHLGPAESGLRTAMAAQPAGRIVVVVAGRLAPEPQWRTDPAWRDRLRIVSLRNLDAADADRYLIRFGIVDDLRPVMIEVSRGHPLALSLLADLGARGQLADFDVAAGLAAAPDVVQVLLARIVDDVPTGLHRDVLEVAAVARVTTQALLRDVVDVDHHRARELFDWLRSRPYITTGPEGVAPHDLVRDLLDADLRWRDPDAYAAVFRRIRRHVHTRLESLRGVEQRRAIADEKFVFRNLPSVLSPVDWSSWGAIDPELATDADRDALVGMVRGHEGADAAAIAEVWWYRQPEAFQVLRGRDGAVVGFMALVTLTDVPESTWRSIRSQLPPWTSLIVRHRPGQVRS